MQAGRHPASFRGWPALFLETTWRSVDNGFKPFTVNTAISEPLSLLIHVLHQLSAKQGPRVMGREWH